MTDLRKAAEMALKALDYEAEEEPDSIWKEERDALRQALAQPEHEPVATVTNESENPKVSMSWWHEPALPVGTKLYTSPQPNKQWVGLTDQELKKMHNEIKVRLMGTYRTEDIYRSIEAKLKEKNHGH